MASKANKIAGNEGLTGLVVNADWSFTIQLIELVGPTVVLVLVLHVAGQWVQNFGSIVLRHLVEHIWFGQVESSQQMRVFQLEIGLVVAVCSHLASRLANRLAKSYIKTLWGSKKLCPIQSWLLFLLVGAFSEPWIIQRILVLIVRALTCWTIYM